MENQIKAFCPKCFMTFEAGKNSSRAIKHSQLSSCDKIPCNRAGSSCIRKFSSINSANRHTYCYTKEQVDKWSESMKISMDLNLNFENLQINDVDEFFADELLFPEAVPEGPPYKYQNNLGISELMVVLARKLGKEFPQDKLNAVKNAFLAKGYTSAAVFRTAKLNTGNWEFVYREFKGIGSEMIGLAHVLKDVLSKRDKEKREDR